MRNRTRQLRALGWKCAAATPFARAHSDFDDTASTRLRNVTSHGLTDDTRRLAGPSRDERRFGSSELTRADGRSCSGHNSRGRRRRGSYALNAVVQSRTRVRVSASNDHSAAHRGCGDCKTHFHSLILSFTVDPTIYNLYITLSIFFSSSLILTPTVVFSGSDSHTIGYCAQLMSMRFSPLREYTIQRQ